MKILFINPSLRPDSPKCIPNVGLAYVASAVERAGIDLEIIDIDANRYTEEQVEKQIRTKKYDAVGIGTLSSAYRWTKNITNVIKTHKPNVPIIVGNILGTSIPKLLLERTYVDIACLGEGDETVVDIISAFDKGLPLDSVNGIMYKNSNEIVETSPRALIGNIDDIPFPNYDLFDMEIYLEKSKWHVASPDQLGMPFENIVAMPVNTTRGCPYRCTFCFNAFQSDKFRLRSPANIIAEIELWKTKYGVNFVNFWDELTFFHRKQTEKFVDLMNEKNINIHWIASCRSELLKKDDNCLAEKLRNAGCHGLTFALENANEEIRRAMNKRNSVEGFINQCRILKQAGINTYNTVIFGYPQETSETIAETFNVLAKCNDYPSVGYLLPLPGTPMFDYAIEHGYIKDVEDYLMIMGDRQDLRVNMTGMTNEEMESAVEGHLIRLSEKLKLGIEKEKLIKTRTWTGSKGIIA